MPASGWCPVGPPPKLPHHRRAQPHPRWRLCYLSLGRWAAGVGGGAYSLAYCVTMGNGVPRDLGTSLEPGEAYLLDVNAFGGMKTSGEKSLTPEFGLTHQKKDDLGDTSVLMGTNSPIELRPGVGLGKDSQWRENPMVNSKYEKRMGSQETKSSLNKEPEMGLEKQSISELALKTPTKWDNLEVNKVSVSQEIKPSLGVLPGRMGLENECLLAECPGGRVKQPPLGMECGSQQVPWSRRVPMARASVEMGTSMGKQPTLDTEPKEELKKDLTCVVTKPSTEMTYPMEVDVGLPQPEKLEPQMGLVIEPPICQFAQQPKVKKEENENIEPPHHFRPIYAGKFFDRMPHWPTAGKVTPVGYRVASCLTEKLPRLITPPEAKKFFNFRYPPAGVERVFYGRANDPQIAPNLTHGITSTSSISASTLINPPPITTFQQKFKDKKESIYFSNQRAPLGKCHDQTPGLPKGMDIINTTFGRKIIRDLSAREVVNPPKSYEEVFKEGKEGHDLYIVSHNDYNVGEAKNRKYNSSHFHRFNLYGAPTPHFNDGRNVAKTFYWLHELQMRRGAKVVSKRVDDFKEKFQHKLGRVLDPIAETMNVPPNHTFGACLCPEEYGAGDLIHNRLPGEYLRGKDRQRAMIAAVRHHLKKVNCQNFDTLLAAFRHYDKKRDGMIDKAELQEACDQANLHLDEKLLDQLFDYCDVDKDGMINYLEFANFLNWKDKMPLKEYEERVIIKGRKQDCANLTEANIKESEPTLLIKPEDIVLKEPGSSEKILRTLLRPSDKVSNEYKTSSSEINAVVGAVPSTCYPIYGIPTIRSDLPAPRLRRISDRTNYGEEGNVYSLLHPTIFSQKGVFERDFFKTRSKEEIAQILCNIGIKLSDEEFENVWTLASRKHHSGDVCVESIRNVLDELQHADRIRCKTTM
ncbi:PREDICTED: EF-hand domain-containing family member B [Chrysochloris asiatica]|uniref:EF-hand domain-containing family member B n=1 Tax=Chrysochloris asiatica TaxID=185453 RepID=A0A9B0TEL8_CHRAS|nr:PREDICTED: EF-hand domain-containing family member B [Chrysochloris asiatica]